ncbi:MAG: ABC transporter permease [Planctomycetes bacterium]|nr:ABC transporter permease [Planctomycetota bacterium]
MENHKSEIINQKSGPTPKTFLAVGPTLHYSHRNVQFYWLLAAFMFCLTCLFWSRIVTGTFWAFDFNAQTLPDLRDLGRATVAGVSIFEYPWQILVLGLLMGILAVVPVLVAQLMSFGHSLIFVLAVFLLANLPGFAGFLLVSCFGAAVRPLRFRSRIIAIALCMAPLLVYWGAFGGARGVEPLEWGFSFAPWIWAWLTGMTIAGLVLALGHYTRYKPGLIWTFTTTTLLLALVLFQGKIGFDELDYQLYVARNNPEEVLEFRDHSIREALDKTITDPKEKEYRKFFFYPIEVIPLREEMKREIQNSLARDNRWPDRLIVSEELQYEDRRKWLNEQYDRFLRPARPRWMPASIQARIVERRSRSKRVVIALYYKALLNEYTPDLRRIGQDETLHFSSDYPHSVSSRIWFELYQASQTCPESAEARWRAARQLAGQREIKIARAFLTEAQRIARERLALLQKTPAGPSESLFSAFRRPPDTVMTPMKLRELQGRIHELQMLVSDENLTGANDARARLAEFVMLNPYRLEYEQQLEGLLARTEENDGLRDNILLAQAKLIADDQHRAERLGQLSRRYQNTDGGKQALYELTRLNIRLYQREPKRANLVLARDMLTNFLDLYPDSFYSPQVKKNLDDLPRPE